MTSAKSNVDASAWSTHADQLILAAAVGVLAVGTVVYRILEDWSWIDSFYFSAVATTTVGFGDLAPGTDAAKLFTVFYIFTGIAVISLFINQRLKRHAERIRERREGG